MSQPRTTCRSSPATRGPTSAPLMLPTSLISSPEEERLFAVRAPSRRGLFGRFFVCQLDGISSRCAAGIILKYAAKAAAPAKKYSASRFLRRHLRRQRLLIQWSLKAKKRRTAVDPSRKRGCRSGERCTPRPAERGWLTTRASGRSRRNTLKSRWLGVARRESFASHCAYCPLPKRGAMQADMPASPGGGLERAGGGHTG